MKQALLLVNNIVDIFTHFQRTFLPGFLRKAFDDLPINSKPQYSACNSVLVGYRCLLWIHISRGGISHHIRALCLLWYTVLGINGRVLTGLLTIYLPTERELSEILYSSVCLCVLSEEVAY